MNIQHIQQLYGDTSQATALLKALKDTEAKSIFLKGLVASAAPVFFSGVAAIVENETIENNAAKILEIFFIMKSFNKIF